MLTLLTFKMTSSQYFGNISVQISPNNNELDIFEIYTEREVGKCPRWTFLTLRKPRKSINKSGNSFGGHPVLLHIFKIKDQKQKKLRNLLKFLLINISKCYSFTETMAYFQALIVDSSTNYWQKHCTWLQMITLYNANKIDALFLYMYNS